MRVFPIILALIFATCGSSPGKVQRSKAPREPVKNHSKKKEEPKKVVKIGFVKFTNVTGRREFAYLSLSLIEALEKDMARNFVFEGKEVQQMAEKIFPQKSAPQNTHLQQLAKRANVDYVVFGYYRKAKRRRIEVTAAVYSLAGNELVRQRSKTMKIDRTIFDRVNEIAAAMVSDLRDYASREKKSGLIVKRSKPDSSLSCPSGYIPVPSNQEVGTKADFCVAKYEMKNVGGVATSQTEGSPWVNITQSQASAECAKAGAHLITNPEWMTIARNIEATATNWSGGAVSSDTLNRGWARGRENSGTAAITGAACLYNVGGDKCGSEGNHLYKRSHSLSNGKQIWDLSGNVSEWVDWKVVSDKASPQSRSLEINSAIPTSRMPASSFQTANKQLTSRHGIGKYYPGQNDRGGVVFRGGSWNVGFAAGAFGLYLLSAPSNANIAIGFRCAR